MGHCVLLRWATWPTGAGFFLFFLSCLILVMNNEGSGRGSDSAKLILGGLNKVRTGNTVYISRIYTRLKTEKTIIFICILFHFFPVLSFPSPYCLTQLSQLVTQTFLEIRKHIFNANNVFLKKVVNTHIFMP